MIKSKYKVTINWNGEVHIFYTYSNTKAKATTNAIIRLAKKVGYNWTVVAAYVFKEDRIKIEEVTDGEDL